MRRREPFPHERRTARPARARPAPRGRNPRRKGVTESPPTVRPGAAAYDRASPGTTARARVRPARGNGRRPRRTYDRTSNGTTAQPSHRTRPHPTHHPHTPTTATHPDRKPHSTSVRQPPPTTGPATNHPTAQPRQRTELEPELDRTRAGTEPNSSRNRTDLDEGGRVGRARCQASLTSSSMSSKLFMSRKRDTRRRALIPRRGAQE